METKNKNEEIQSRREFFKKAAKAALPVVGAVVAVNFPITAKAQYFDYFEYFGRWEPIDTCSNCSNSCTGSCKTNCDNSCKNTCEGCRGTCEGCRDTCYGSCRGSCRLGLFY